MATIPPPATKRQKLEALSKSVAQVEPEVFPTDLGSVRIQFLDHETQQPQTESVLVPLHQFTEVNLRTLLSHLRPDNKEEGKIRVTTTGEDIDTARSRLVAERQGGQWRDEPLITIDQNPQAIFRVRPPTRNGATIRIPQSQIFCMDFAPSTSDRVVVGGDSHDVRVLDCNTGTTYRTLSGHTGMIWAVAYSPDGAIIATGSTDRTIRLWNAKDGSALGNALQGHRREVRFISWEPYHRQTQGRPRLASASEDHTVRIWDVVGRKLDFTLSGHAEAVTSVRWGGIGLIYTTSRDRTVKIWSATDGRILATLRGHSSRTNHIALSTDQALRTGYFSPTGPTPETDADRIKAAKRNFSQAARAGSKLTERVISASDDGTMILWEPYEADDCDVAPRAGDVRESPKARLLGHRDTINRVAWSPNGLMIASASFDKSVRLWNAATGAHMRTLVGHVLDVYCCCFSPDSRFVASASADSTVKVWDVMGSGKALRQDLSGHTAAVFALDWSRDGKRIGSGGRDKAVKLWVF